MGDFNKQICRLCLVISPTCECETVDEIKKEKLQVLQINMDFDISNRAVACNRCLERLQDCFDFKSRIITTHMDDIKKTSQREMIGDSLCLEKFQGCQLCMSLIKEEVYNYTSDLKGAVLIEDMIRNCFPEVNLNVHESHTCKQCVSSLERHYEFKKCCQEVEQKIVRFCQVANDCTADKVNLEDMLNFKDYDMLGTPLIIKKKCSDAENVDENTTKCPKREDIASIKCEEIHIKDELDNGVQTNDYGELTVHNSSGDSRSSKETTKTTTFASKRKKHFCHKCPYSSDKSSNMKRHMLTHSDNEVHGCTLCSFITNTKLSWKAHMTSHRGLTKKYACPECTYEADSTYSLGQHRLKHKDNSEVKMYECPLCPFKTKYKYCIIKHRKKVLHKNLQEIPKHKCEMCDYKSKDKSSLVKHMRNHGDPKVAYKFQCAKCSYKAKWKSNLKRHIMVHHSIEHPYRVQTNDYGELTVHNSSGDSRSSKETTKTRTSASKGKKHFCHKCPYSSNISNNMKKHMLTHSDNEVHGCTICSFITNTRFSLQAHMTSHRGLTKKYACPECTYEIDSKHNLGQHRLKHRDKSELKMYECPLCPYKTKYKYCIIKHRKQGLHKNPQEIPKHKCEVCGYEFKYPKNLVKHMQTHENPKVAYKFQCAKCSYKTKWKCDLKKHIMAHHSIKHPYRCDQCTFSTKFSMSLQLHEYLHQKKGEKGYKCKLCPYQAGTTRSVRFHMIRTHTIPSEVLKFECTHCPFETVYKHSLLRHRRGCHNIENQSKVKCDLCNYVTTDKSNLRRHLFVHGEATIQCCQCGFQTKWKSCLQKHMKQHQAGSCSPTKQQTISLKGDKNRNSKKNKNEDKKKDKNKV